MPEVMKKESGVVQFGDHTTPLSKVPTSHETSGDYAMNITTQTPPATFAEFLSRPEISDEIENLHCSFGDSGIQFPENAVELLAAIGWAGITGDELAFNLEELAYKFQNAGEIVGSMASAYEAQKTGEVA